jgi:hypothetical protein
LAQQSQQGRSPKATNKSWHSNNVILNPIKI